MKTKCYLCASAILAIILLVASLPLQAHSYGNGDPAPVDPSLFGDYDTSTSAHTPLGLLAKGICRLATPIDVEFIYAPSEHLFAATNEIQYWGCPNASRATFQRARELFQEWRDRHPTVQPVIHAEWQ